MRFRRVWSTVTAVVVSCALVGCGGVGDVVRMANGHVVRGRFISPEAYAAFLRGALAEQDGDMRRALTEYEWARSTDPEDTEIWTRIARVRCRLDPSDVAANDAIEHALRLDPRYEPALLAKASCANVRGRPREAAEEIARATTWEPLSVEPEVDRAALTLPSATTAEVDRERSRLIALTLVHGGRVEAWEALIAWGNAHADVTLAVRGMIEVARLDPSRQYRIGESAIALAGSGWRSSAAEIAGALLDAPGDRSSGGQGRAAASLALVARLAMDDAIGRQDRQRVTARAARAHLAMEVVAARAWVLGDLSLARELAGIVVKADPLNLAARLVLEGARGRASSHLTATSGAPASMPLPAEVALPFARDVVATEGAEAARRALRAMGRVSLLPGDALLTPLTVDLAILGVLPEADLPADARIELSARSLRAPSEGDLQDPNLDARHRLLGLALVRPEDPTTLDLRARLAPAALHDPLIAVALARLSFAKHEALAPALAERLEAFAVSDPLTAVLLIELVSHSGPPAAIAQARLRLARLAKTPAERARAVQ